MTISTDTPPTGTLAAVVPRRAGRELVLEWVFQPLSSLLLPVLIRLRLGPPASGGSVERALARVYRLLCAPQDRLVRAVSERRFEKAALGRRTPQAGHAYFDSVTLAILANLGLTTQLTVLGACLVLGVPALYLWLAVGGFLALVPLQLRRERLVRNAALR